ncbi:MAG: hypothetical protein A2W09_01085 [Deltaproteobacteria bacterium RBG_16_50_11]|nr:MAG: hypothetical protein A2W09_01085 [Deltaproteobacteria bacterium RBG_16_50_11]
MCKWLMVVVTIALDLLILAASPSFAEQTKDPEIEQALTDARQASDELGGKVRGLLLREIEKGGFANAVRVCSEVAQGITLRFNEHKGHHTRRVSLRYRNPKNFPDPFEQRKLGEFDRWNREKKLADEYIEVVKEGEQEYLRYMKPLIVQPVCIACHGPRENIPAKVKLILEEKYPEDRATVFLVGDVRGAISVKIRLPR